MVDVHTSLRASVYQAVKVQPQEDNINVALDMNCPEPGDIHLGSAEMPGHTPCWVCVLPTSIQHGTEVLMPEGR